MLETYGKLLPELKSGLFNYSKIPNLRTIKGIFILKQNYIIIHFFDDIILFTKLTLRMSQSQKT